MTFDRFLQEAALLEGIAWRKYRRRSARHRVELRMKELGLDGFGAYLDLLRSDPEETAGLADLMRVTVSRFFREREQWQALADSVLPALLAGKTGTEALRIWSAGCCCGEEPYTLAMVWLENIAPFHPGSAVVLCRYLAFTYYRGERLLAATARLREALRPGGVLMVGKKERLPGLASAFFEPWPGCDGFYRRKG